MYATTVGMIVLASFILRWEVMEAFARPKLKCFQGLVQCWKMFVSSYPWNNFLLYLLLCATQ